MHTDVIIAGVGGQGILSIAACIGLAATSDNLYMKQSEVHGMSQRGGAVQSNLRISDQEIFSDLIPLGSADLIISVEPMEALRYLPWLSESGWLVTNTTPFKNITDYPPPDELMQVVRSLKNHIAVDADSIAKKIGAPKASNMVMLGAATPFLKIDYEKITGAVSEMFSRKGPDIVELNLKALEQGRKVSQA